MEDLGVPLDEVSMDRKPKWPYIDVLTLSMTFSSEFGQSMAKQTKRMSVSG